MDGRSERTKYCGDALKAGFPEQAQLSRTKTQRPLWYRGGRVAAALSAATMWFFAMNAALWGQEVSWSPRDFPEVVVADAGAPLESGKPLEATQLQDRPGIRTSHDKLTVQPRDAGSVLQRNHPKAADFLHPHRAGNRRGRNAYGTVRASIASTPAMIGDFFGGNFIDAGELQSPSPIPGDAAPTISLAGADRRFKVAENVSPIPRDRIFFNFNHFRNALVDVNRRPHSLDRSTFGFEKTFFQGLASIETRLPLVSGLNSRQVVGVPDQTGTELGNLALAFKVNLLSGSNYLIAGGASMTLPTGDDYELFDFPGASVAVTRIQNQAVHLAPYVGWLFLHDEFFLQGFIQADFDLRGNDVYRFGVLEGILQDQNLLFVDAAVGRWIYRNENSCVSGVCAMGELHYTSTINDTDDVTGLSNPFNRMDILNATAALHFQFGRNAFRIGGTLPLRDDEEELFDGEFLFQLNRRF